MWLPPTHRYDVRAHLLDVSGDSSESSDSDEEMIEELCDEERYLSLKTNVVQEEEEKGTEMRMNKLCDVCIVDRNTDNIKCGEADFGLQEGENNRTDRQTDKQQNDSKRKDEMEGLCVSPGVW